MSVVASTSKLMPQPRAHLPVGVPLRAAPLPEIDHALPGEPLAGSPPSTPPLRWRRAAAALAISAAAHALVVFALGLCAIAVRPTSPPLLVTELQWLRPAADLPDVRPPDDLPETRQPAGSASGTSAAVVHHSATIDPAAWSPHIDPPMLVASRMLTLELPDHDRELSIERRTLPRMRQATTQPPQQPAAAAEQDERTVIELPTGLKGMGGMFIGRQPALKPLLIKKFGGDDETEAAVKRGLDWLKRHQQPDGRWTLHSFSSLPECHGQCTHAGVLSDTAGTALAILPFLAADSTHLEGEHAALVGRGLAWLLARQRNDGGWTDGPVVKTYAHALAVIALSEAYAMTGDPRLRKPIENALGVIAEFQDEGGGWRYATDQEGDCSVTGWQLMALRCAMAGGIAVPREMLDSAMEFLTTVEVEKGRGLFGYSRKHPPSDAMTAEGLLSREYGGWPYEHPALRSGVNALVTSYKPSREKVNMYYWYYGTQVLHHVGGKPWLKWNELMRRMLIDLQIKQGHMAGSWTPKEQHDMAGGRLYMTALGTLTLEVYYRHLPIYAKYSMAGEKPPAEKK